MLQAWQPCEEDEEELTRSMTRVEVILGDRKLVGNGMTLESLGVCQEATLQVVFCNNPIECASRAQAPADVEELLVVSIPESETSVPDGAFASCSSLVKVIIPNSVRRLGESAFADCTSLRVVHIPDSVTEIASGCLRGV